MQQAESKWFQDLPPLRTQERWPLPYPGRFVKCHGWKHGRVRPHYSSRLVDDISNTSFQCLLEINEPQSIQNIAKHKQAHPCGHCMGILFKTVRGTESLKHASRAPTLGTSIFVPARPHADSCVPAIRVLPDIANAKSQRFEKGSRSQSLESN